MLKPRFGYCTLNFTKTLYRAVPAVALGTLFNILDAVSVGLLVFPSGSDGDPGSVFQSIRLQGISLFIMSTITSQIVTTFGGSRFSGGIGTMLVEILPFLRGIANDIRAELGDQSPSLIPTVMAAYALTSLLTGSVLVILGALKLGNLVTHLPRTVLTGAVGSIGLSLFILGLGLTLPPTSPPLTFSSTKSVLFRGSHLPLLAATFFPPFFLSVSTRSQKLNRWTRGFIQNDYYVPLFLITIPAIFWTVVGARQYPHRSLVTNGWLFDMGGTVSGSEVVNTWNYWKLFDFSSVEWRGMKSATTNIVLLVIISVMNPSAFIPALAFSLDVSYNMNREFVGQGAANILSGITGSVPNILQYSYSIFFIRAHGGRFEAAIVILLTFGLLLTSSLLLPYVPTILAAAIVVFLGLELLFGAVWESSKTLTVLEWNTVISTLIACTFLGFAEGLGIGIAVATVVYLIYGFIDSRPKTGQMVDLETGWNKNYQLKVVGESDKPQSDTQNAKTHSPPSENSSFSLNLQADSVHSGIDVRVVTLRGYLFFATIPSLENAIVNNSRAFSNKPDFVIIDMLSVHRVETAVAYVFERARRDIAPIPLVLCGMTRESGVVADFERAGVMLDFQVGCNTTRLSTPNGVEDTRSNTRIQVFTTRGDAIFWCQFGHQRNIYTTLSRRMVEQDEKLYESFCTRFNFDPPAIFASQNLNTESDPSLFSLSQFLYAGGRIGTYSLGQSIVPIPGDTELIFIVDGDTEVIKTSCLSPPNEGIIIRPSLRAFLVTVPRKSLILLTQLIRSIYPRKQRRSETVSMLHMGPGHVLDLRKLSSLTDEEAKTQMVVCSPTCHIVEIGSGSSEALINWAERWRPR